MSPVSAVPVPGTIPGSTITSWWDSPWRITCLSGQYRDMERLYRISSQLVYVRSGLQLPIREAFFTMC